MAMIYDKVKIPNHFFCIQDIKSMFHITLCCIALTSAGVLAYYFNYKFIYLISFILVGIFGEALFMLQHDAMHGVLLSNRKWNDNIGALLSAMLGTRLYDGRMMHMRHHAGLGTSDDPNMYWYDELKVTPGLEALTFMIKQLLGAKLYAFVIRTFSVLVVVLTNAGSAKKNNSTTISNNRDNKKEKIDILSLVVVQLFLLLVISSLSSPWVYFLLYFLPIITVTSYLESLRTFSEHVNYPSNDVDQDNSNNSRLDFVDCSSIERLILAPYGFHYHHLHHLYPTISVF